MPNKNNSNDALIEQLQKNIDLKFGILVEQYTQLNACLDKIEGQIEKYTKKLDALEDFVKESFDQFNKKLAQHAAKITALENFRIATETLQEKHQLWGYPRWAVLVFIAAVVIGAAIEQLIVSPLVNVVH